MNKRQRSEIRQKHALSAMRTTRSPLRQFEKSVAWYIWHPTSYRVRLSLTCRDVWDLVQRGILKSPQRDKLRGHYLA